MAHIKIVIFQFVFKRWCKNAGGISPPSLLSRLSQNYLVAMATSLDRSSAPKTLSFSEKIAKIGPADPELSVSDH